MFKITFYDCYRLIDHNYLDNAYPNGDIPKHEFTNIVKYFNDNDDWAESIRLNVEESIEDYDDDAPLSDEFRIKELRLKYDEPRNDIRITIICEGTSEDYVKAMAALATYGAV